MDNYETISIEVDAELLRAAQDICAKLGITVEELVRQFLFYVIKESALLEIVAEAQAEAGVLNTTES